MNPLSHLFDAPTYARARLSLGMAGVGTFVTLSLVAIIAGLPATLFEGKGGGLFTDASLIAVWMSGAALLALPFEILGGYFLPKKFGRKHPDGLGEWVLAWVRGVLIMVLTMSFSGAAIIVAGRYGGSIGAMVMLILVMLVLVSLQTWLAKLVGGLRRVRARTDIIEDDMRTMAVVAPKIIVLDADDEGFTGGIAGLPTADTLILPNLWFDRMDPEAVAVLVARRTAIIDRGLRALGLVGAMGWTVLAFALASLMPAAGVYSVDEVLGTSLWFTIFSVIGFVALPTPSRAATIAADGCTAADIPGRTAEVLGDAVATLDQLQDDEPERASTIERIVHPIPNVKVRQEAMTKPEPEVAPWHIAPTATYLSIAGMSPLSRLVPGNVGRPELWVFLPTDG